MRLLKMSRKPSGYTFGKPFDKRLHFATAVANSIRYLADSAGYSRQKANIAFGGVAAAQVEVRGEHQAPLQILRFHLNPPPSFHNTTATASRHPVRRLQYLQL